MFTVFVSHLSESFDEIRNFAEPPVNGIYNFDDKAGRHMQYLQKKLLMLDRYGPKHVELTPEY